MFCTQAVGSNVPPSGHQQKGCMAYLAVLDHEASKEDPPVGAAFSHQGISCALHYLLHHLFLYHWGNSWAGE